MDKGGWDKSRGFEKDNEFNRAWLSLCRDCGKEVIARGGNILPA